MIKGKAICFPFKGNKKRLFPLKGKQAPQKKKEGKKVIVKRHGKRFAMVFHKEKEKWVYIPEKRFLRMSAKELYNYEW